MKRLAVLSLDFLTYLYNIYIDIMSLNESLSIFDEKELSSFKKDKVVNIIIDLQRKVEELTSFKIIEKRVEKMERTQFSHLQYERRDTIEIDGISNEIKNEELEGVSLGLLKDIGVECGSNSVQAVHRLNKRGTVIMKFINRKIASAAIGNRRKLREFDEARQKKVRKKFI